jgi:hypothetical protein
MGGWFLITEATGAYPEETRLQRRENMPETIALINLLVPDINLLHTDPGFGNSVPYGVHLANLSNSRSRWIENRFCGGILDLYSTWPKGSAESHYRDNKPAEIRCENCNFRTSLENYWEDSVMEWMLTVFSSALMDLTGHEYGPENFSGLLWHSNQWDSLCSFSPEELGLDVSLRKHLEPGHRSFANLNVPYWPKQGFAVANIKGLNPPDPRGLISLFAMTAVLLRRMETGFQDSIKRSATITGSASEIFHPQTRR